MKHYGDITQIKGAEVPIVDIVTGGSPCQDLSVAGKRAGLDGERSGLFMEQVRVFKEMRNECIRQIRMRGADVDVRSIRPRFFVWENVPGALSSPGKSNRGADFRCVLEEVCRIADKDANVPMPEKGKWSTSGCIMGDGYSVAWRVHDAQFWGVPQRRKRISLVADFGGESAPEILFERKSVSGDIEESREEGQGVAADTERSVDKAIVYGIGSYDSNAMKSSNPHSGIYEADTSRTLDLNGGSPACNQGGMMVLDGFNLKENEKLSPTLTCQRVDTKNVPIVIEGNGQRESHKGDGYKESDTMYTLNTVEQHAVCVSQDAYDKFTENDKSASLKASGGTYGGGERSISDTVGALCASDYKGVGNQYVSEGKCIVQNIGESSGR